VEINQKKHSNKIRYAFGEDELDYSIEDGSGSRSFSVAYSEIGRDRQTLVERNQWLRNVGLLWIALGVVFTGLSLSGDGALRVSVWLWIGLACYAVYRFRATRYTIVPTDRGNLLVIDGSDGERILGELAARRVAYLRREYDFLPESDSPEQHRNRFNWLHREGALSDDELKQRLATVDAMDPVRTTMVGPEAGVRLN
jgi:hypothetical protein